MLRKTLFSLLMIMVALTLLCGESKQRVALLGLERSGVDEITGKNIEASITSLIASSDRFIIYERAQLDKIFAEQELSVSDDFNDTYAVDIGNLIGVEVVLVGTISKVNNKIMIILRGIDVNSAEILFSGMTSMTGSDVNTSALKTMLIKMGMVSPLKLPPIRIAAISLVCAGGISFAAGLSVFLYNRLVTSPALQQKISEGGSYSSYETLHITNLAMFATSLSVLVLGGIMMVIAIPLFVIKTGKKSNTAFYVGGSADHLNIGFTIKIGKGAAL